MEIYPTSVWKCHCWFPLGAAYGIDPWPWIIFLANGAGLLDSAGWLNLLMSSYRFRKPVPESNCAPVLPIIAFCPSGSANHVNSGADNDVYRGYS